MTPKELAENIFEQFDKQYGMAYAPNVVNYIESLLSSALEEARKSGFDLGIDDSLNQLKRNYEQGRKDAYEDAIKAIEEQSDGHCDGCSCDAIAVIRQRAEALK